MDSTITGIIPATTDETVIHHDASDADQKIAELQVRLASLEEDFSKLTAFVNNINDRLQ